MTTLDPLISGGGAVILLGIAKYFFMKIDRKIDETSDAVVALGARMDARINNLEDKMVQENKAVRRDIVETFQAICHERQDACGKLRDAKLMTVETTVKGQCAKILALIDDRNKRWERQDILNDQIKTHIAK